MDEQRPTTTSVVSENTAAPATSPAQPETNSAEAAFARKEQQIRQQQKALAAERAKWQQEQKATEAKYKSEYVPKNRLTEDPLSVLSEAGITMEQLGKMLLDQPNQNDPTVRALRAEMKAIKDAQAAQAQQAADAQTQQYEQAKKQIGNEAKLLIDSDPEFETLKAEGLHDSVLELIVETFETEGRLMDVREACLEVENYLVEQGLKFASYKKVQSKLAPKETVAQTPAVPKPVTQKAPTVQLKTLTNQLQTTPTKKSSDAEKRARAIAAFTGNKVG